MNIELIQVPFDSGYLCVRTGCGPDYFLNNGITKILQNKGHYTNVHRIESKISFNAEIRTAFELNRFLAQHIRTLSDGCLPIVISGNCNSCVGTLAGINSNDVGIIWFGAHGDFNTPDTTISGFLDGMGLAMAIGKCWKSLLHTIPGYKPVPESNVIHVGSLDLDDEEKRMFEQAGIPLITTESRDESAFISSFRKALVNLAKQVKRIYVHIDMDVLEAGQAKANHLAISGGLRIETVVDCIKLIKDNFTICACGIASIDPDFDQDNIVLNAGFRLIEAILEN